MDAPISKSDSYAAAGVDVTAGYEAVNRIRPLAESTFIPGVLSGLGGFGCLFEPQMAGMSRPVLVSGTDGVGTKLKIAFLMDKHDTIGIDCVAMCVNDIICSGAAPLFFLDYLALGKNIPSKVESIVSGIVAGCLQAGCALIGGETAEMPGFYPEDEYDLAGFAVGLADHPRILDGSKTKVGDALIGLASSGLHSNGFSLVRKLLAVDAAVLSTYSAELGCTIGEELLRPTRIYAKAIGQLLKSSVRVSAISHITGGGLYENVPRMLPAGLTAMITASAVPVCPIFRILQLAGDIPERDMYNTFNMGMGMVIAADQEDVGDAIGLLTQMGESAYVIGQVQAGEAGVVLC